LAADAPQKETGKFWRDRKVIPWWQRNLRRQRL